MGTDPEIKIRFLKEQYFKNKMINKVYEYKPQWLMAFEYVLPNVFYLISRLKKEITEKVDIFFDQPSKGLRERPIICQGCVKVPDIEDLHLIKHNHGVFLYETRKKKVYNIQLSKLKGQNQRQSLKLPPISPNPLSPNNNENLKI